MKRIVIVLLLSLSGLLAGCQGFVSGPYVSTKPHTEQSHSVAENSTSVSNYAELCFGIESLIAEGQEFGIIYYQDYDEDMLKNDLQIAAKYVKERLPLGAYALKSISYETGSASNGHAIAFTLSYHHTRSEIKKVKNVPSLDAAKDAVFDALSHCDSDLVIQVDGYIDTDFIQLIEDYTLIYPEIIMEAPSVSVAEYPESGSSRILEFKFSYTTSRDSLRDMKNTVTPIFSSATLYVSKDAEPTEKIMQLYAFLSQRYDYRYESSITPAYSLLRHGVGDSRAFASVYAAMCRNVDVTCYIVSGTKNGQPYYWNIIFDNDRCYHVDLIQSIEDDSFSKKTDSEMLEYVWNYTAYPTCDDVASDPVNVEE